MKRCADSADRGRNGLYAGWRMQDQDYTRLQSNQEQPAQDRQGLEAFFA